MALIAAEEAKDKVTQYKTSKKNTFKNENASLINALSAKIIAAADEGKTSCKYVVDESIEYGTFKEILEDAGYSIKAGNDNGVTTINVSWSN
ncbi:MAG: hypothetical protein IKR04_04900 [Clostridia bacterium]|nr:hypothetical protein [Clostridia bacterium]